MELPFISNLGVALHSGLRSCWLLAKTVHRTVFKRSALAGLSALSFHCMKRISPLSLTRLA